MTKETIRFFSPKMPRKVAHGEHFVDELTKDLENAKWVHFLSCYFNPNSKSNFYKALVKAMNKSGSRGLISLTLATRYEAFEKMWQKCNRPERRFKCFVPALVGDKTPESQIPLLHSKVVLVAKPADSGLEEVVLYIGSHNWTHRGLQQEPKHNVEASVRLSTTLPVGWHDELTRQLEHPSTQRTHAQHQPGSVAPAIFDAYEHIHRCFHLESNKDLCEDNATKEFKSWIRAAKSIIPQVQRESLMVGVAVVGQKVDPDTLKRGRVLHTENISFPRRGDTIAVHHIEKEGETTSFRTVPWFLFVWDNDTALQNPKHCSHKIILCRVTKIATGETARVFADKPKWLLYEPKDNNNAEVNYSLHKTHSQRERIEINTQQVSRPVKGERWVLAPTDGIHEAQQLFLKKPDHSCLLEVITTIDSAQRKNGRDFDRSGKIFLQRTSSRSETKQKFVAYDTNGPSDVRARKMRDEQREFFGENIDDNGPGPIGSEIQTEVYADSPVNDLLASRNPRNEDREEKIRNLYWKIRVDDSIRDEKGILRLELLRSPNRSYLRKVLNVSNSEWRELWRNDET
jgi:hypothetical protein